MSDAAPPPATAAPPPVGGAGAPSACVSLQKKAQGGAVDCTDVELALLELCALVPLSTDAIWEGAPELFPVLFQFKDSFERLSAAGGEDASTNNALTFNLPSGEFPVKQKRFRVNRNLPTRDLIQLLCAKLGVSGPERFSLFSLRGFRFNPAEPLAGYGFGILFKAWELNVSYTPVTSLACLTPAPVVAPAGETVVLYFPPLLDIAGLKKKTTKLTTAELNMPIAQIIAKLWLKLGLSGPERFTLIAPPDKSRGASCSLVLSPQHSLTDYGLGWRFHGWELRVEFISLAECMDTARTATRHYPWLCVPAARSTTEELTECCFALDQRLTQCEQEKADLAATVDTLQQQQQQQPMLMLPCSGSIPLLSALPPPDQQDVVTTTTTTAATAVAPPEATTTTAAAAAAATVGEADDEDDESDEDESETRRLLLEQIDVNKRSVACLAEMQEEQQTLRNRNDELARECTLLREGWERVNVQLEAMTIYAWQLKKQVAELQSAPGTAAMYPLPVPDDEKDALAAEAQQEQMAQLQRENARLAARMAQLEEDNRALVQLLAKAQQAKVEKAAEEATAKIEAAQKQQESKPTMHKKHSSSKHQHQHQQQQQQKPKQLPTAPPPAPPAASKTGAQQHRQRPVTMMLPGKPAEVPPRTRKHERPRSINVAADPSEHARLLESIRAQKNRILQARGGLAAPPATAAGAQQSEPGTKLSEKAYGMHQVLVQRFVYVQQDCPSETL